MKTVYALTKGEYSDYRVVYICESKDVAEEVLRLSSQADGVVGYEADQYEIEEMTVLESIDEWRHDHRYVYRVRITESQDGTQKKFKSAFWAYEGVLNQKGAFHYKQPGNEYQAWAHSERGYDVAEKICYDLIAQEKAKEAGLA